MLSEDDRYFLNRAILLAKRGLGDTSPNPIVGALIVKDKRIIGSGYHSVFGSDHAEVVALKTASEDPEGATLYSTLEPCNHQGKRGSCAEAILKAKIKKVVIGSLDRSVKKGPKGAYILKKSEVEVIFADAELKEKSDRLVADFHKFELEDRPWILLKTAETLDGRISTATGESKWISSERSRKEAHRLRRESDAILIGSNTLKEDNPSLTLRGFKKKRPLLRVVLDTDLSIDFESKIVQDLKREKSLIFTSSDADFNKVERLREKGVEVVIVRKKGDLLDLEDILNRLKDRSVMRLLVEGGSRISGSFLSEDLVDEVAIFIAPKMVGGDRMTNRGFKVESLNRALKIKVHKKGYLGGDIYIRGDVDRSSD